MVHLFPWLLGNNNVYIYIKNYRHETAARIEIPLEYYREFDLFIELRGRDYTPLNSQDKCHTKTITYYLSARRLDDGKKKRYPTICSTVLFVFSPMISMVKYFTSEKICPILPRKENRFKIPPRFSWGKKNPYFCFI